MNEFIKHIAELKMEYPDKVKQLDEILDMTQKCVNNEIDEGYWLIKKLLEQ